MERLKAKIVKNFDLLKEEHDAVLVVLNNILEKNREIVKDTANERQMTTNKKYLLNILEFQHSMIQKLLEIGMELDEFSKTSVSPYLGHLSEYHTKSEISPISSSLCLTGFNSPPISNTQEEQVYEAPMMSPTPIISEIIEECTAFNVKLDKSDALSSENCSVMNMVDTSEKPNIEFNANEGNDNLPVAVNNYEEILSGSAPELDKGDNKVLSEDTSSSGSASRSNKDDGKKASADVSSSEETSQKEKFKTKTIQEKLKSRKLMTKRDRYLQNLQIT